MSPDNIGPVNSNQNSSLEQSHREAMAFTLSKVRSLKDPHEVVLRYASEEISYGTINIDDAGVTSGMRRAIMEPTARAESEWRHLKNRFETALQPYIADITAVVSLRRDVDAIRQRRTEQLNGIDLELRQNPKFVDIEENYHRSKGRYDRFRDKYANRDAQMFAYRRIYWILLGLVLLTECFVNYHAFNQFWGVPAVALGTTIILGLLLALAAHQHGELLKQWSYLFERSKSPAERAGSWRMFGISTSALGIVLGFTGWARWAAAVEAVRDQSSVGESILGNVGIVQINPVRDVFISLIANLGAWMVGVIISYAGHDRDPDYMDITKQYRIHRKIWEKMQMSARKRKEHIVALADKNIADKERVAETRSKSVKQQLDMMEQVNMHDAAVNEEIRATMREGLGVYKDAILTAARSGTVKLFLSQSAASQPLSPLDYQRMPIEPQSTI